METLKKILTVTLNTFSTTVEFISKIGIWSVGFAVMTYIMFMPWFDDAVASEAEIPSTYSWFLIILALAYTAFTFIMEWNDYDCKYGYCDCKCGNDTTFSDGSTQTSGTNKANTKVTK